MEDRRDEVLSAEMSEQDLEGLSGGTPTGGLLGGVASALGLGGLPGKIKETIETVGDSTESAVDSLTGGQIFSKRKRG